MQKKKKKKQAYSKWGEKKGQVSVQKNTSPRHSERLSSFSAKTWSQNWHQSIHVQNCWRTQQISISVLLRFGLLRPCEWTIIRAAAPSRLILSKFWAQKLRSFHLSNSHVLCMIVIVDDLLTVCFFFISSLSSPAPAIGSILSSLVDAMVAFILLVHLSAAARQSALSQQVSKIIRKQKFDHVPMKSDKNPVKPSISLSQVVLLMIHQFYFCLEKTSGAAAPKKHREPSAATLVNLKFKTCGNGQLELLLGPGPSIYLGWNLIENQVFKSPKFSKPLLYWRQQTWLYETMTDNDRRMSLMSWHPPICCCSKLAWTGDTSRSVFAVRHVLLLVTSDESGWPRPMVMMNHCDAKLSLLTNFGLNGWPNIALQMAKLAKCAQGFLADISSIEPQPALSDLRETTQEWDAKENQQLHAQW